MHIHSFCILNDRINSRSCVCIFCSRFCWFVVFVLWSLSVSHIVFPLLFGLFSFIQSTSSHGSHEIMCCWNVDAQERNARKIKVFCLQWMGNVREPKEFHNNDNGVSRQSDANYFWLRPILLINDSFYHWFRVTEW